MRKVLATVIGFLALAACMGQPIQVEISAGSLEIGIDGRGWVVSFRDMESGTAYLPRGHDAPLLTVQVDGERLSPITGRFDSADSVLTLTYGPEMEARVRLRTRETHATLELLSVTDPAAVELAIWGPYSTTISETIGETVGVVRGPVFAMGLQALNPKTLGGYPWNENDAMPQLDIFESGDFSDLSEEGKRHVLYRVEAAKPDSFGSTLQAYVRNRNRERIVPNWGHDRYTVPVFEDGGVVGSKIALFGGPAEDALGMIGSIEVAEGLPHPTIDGEWGKEAPGAAAGYVIMPFSEATVDDAVDVVLRAGLRYLYHPEPFETWGHFHLNQDFPNGWEGLRETVARAESRGVRVGVHTLSNFITTDDPYVTPVPDPRLARVGTTRLTRSIDPGDEEVGIEDPGFFNQFGNNTLRAAVVGSEILQYTSVSDEAPWRLLGVERGAFGTLPGVHQAGVEIGKLADHGYRVFLTDVSLTIEMATTLARLFNQTGLRQISFDGLEGNRSTGMGNYGEILFTSTWYDALSEDIRNHYIADASRTSHYFWHIYSRMNWGEPWYAGFRESQTEYRLKNQAYFRRNMMPGMLGWFRMQPETSVEDIEWMLARSAAFDAGYAFVTSFEALEENGRTGENLELMGRWEEARMTDSFTEEQKRRMESIGNEFHLEEAGIEGWTLWQIHPLVFRFGNPERQPGEPSQSTYTFNNPEGEQSLRFAFSAAGGAVDGFVMELDGTRRLEWSRQLGEGETLVYEGGDEATHYSSQWMVLDRVPLDPTALRLLPGDHTLSLQAGVPQGIADAQLKLEIRIWGEPEVVPRG